MEKRIVIWVDQLKQSNETKSIGNGTLEQGTFKSGIENKIEISVEWNKVNRSTVERIGKCNKVKLLILKVVLEMECKVEWNKVNWNRME